MNVRELIAELERIDALHREDPKNPFSIMEAPVRVQVVSYDSSGKESIIHAPVLLDEKPWPPGGVELCVGVIEGKTVPSITIVGVSHPNGPLAPVLGVENV